MLDQMLATCHESKATGCAVATFLVAALAVPAAVGGGTAAPAAAGKVRFVWEARAAAVDEAQRAQSRLNLTLFNTGRLPLTEAVMGDDELPGDVLRRTGAWVCPFGQAMDNLLCVLNPKVLPRVIFPAGAGVMSAFGLLVSPLSFELIRSDTVFLDDITALEFEQRFRPLIETACEHLRQAGVSDGDIRVSRRLDMRYRGQGHEIDVAVPENGDGNDDGLLARLPTLFAERYREIFALSFLEQPLEIVNWKLEAAGPRPEMGPRAIGSPRSPADPRR